jgi:hypothetical protein
MLKQDGIALFIILVFLYSTLIFFQNVMEHLLMNGYLFHQWTLYLSEKQEMQQLASQLISEFTGTRKNFTYHNAQTFDYSWQYLGEYKCIVICKPKCAGTKHWLLKIKSNTRSMHWRVALPDFNLACETENVLKLTHNVMYYRVVHNVTVMKE